VEWPPSPLWCPQITKGPLDWTCLSSPREPVGPPTGVVHESREEEKRRSRREKERRGEERREDGASTGSHSSDRGRRRNCEVDE